METFSKKERLCNHAITERLFLSGHQLRSQPFILLWDECALPAEVPLQIMVTVSKKRFPHAVDRNRIKRQCREAIRKNKEELTEFLRSRGRQCALCIMYTGNGNDAYALMESKIILLLQRLQNQNLWSPQSPDKKE
jgi:ribonuclease P protein component